MMEAPFSGAEELVSAVGNAVTLDSLLEGLPVSGLASLGHDADMPVTGIEFDSRKVHDGDLFVAWPGERFDGRKFAVGAVERGAVGVIAKGEPLQPVDVPWLCAEDPRRLLGPLAARIYGRPDRDLCTVGVTGTNGKTTTMFLVAAILESAGKPCGNLGTLGYAFGTHHFGGERTTPEASDMFRLLSTMHELGAEAASFEISSHALDQGRVDEIRLDVGVFTNLTRDHFDYHGDFEHYYNAKRNIFTLLKEHGSAVICRDDEWGRRLLGEIDSSELAAAQLSGRGRVISYGESKDEAGFESVDLESVSLDRRGLQASLRTPSGLIEIETPLLGRYNLWNIMAAVAVAETLEIPHEATRAALSQQGAVPGRLQRVDAGQDFLVLVDYAHTDGALQATLQSVRSLWPGRLMVVFGCGGNRDQGKRPLMGKAAATLADLAIITDDNPRDEDPAAIHAAVLAGVSGGSNEHQGTGEEGADQPRAEIQVIGDRREAIQYALDRAEREDGWAVVVAGKGHESGQTVGADVRPFNDCEEIVRILEGAADGPNDHA